MKQDKLFAATGIASVVLTLAGASLAMAAGKTHDLTVGTSTSKLAEAIAQPATTATWVGAYAELLGCLVFLCFAVWVCGKLGEGLWSNVGVAAASAYTAVTVVSLGLMDAISYRAGHGLGIGLARTLVTLNESLYVTTWFLMALFLAAAAVLAVAARRRVVGWSAAAVAAVSALAPLAFDGIGQAAGMLSFVWVIVACVALVRGEPQRVPLPATA